MGSGRFVRDPELKPVNDTHVCEFSLAVNEYRKVNGERRTYTHFFDFVVWDKAAELICEYRKKGDLLEFVASPRQERWEDSEGNRRQKIVFRIDEFSFLPRGSKPAETVEKEEEVETPF